MMTAERFANASTMADYIAATVKNTEFWRGVDRLARLPDDVATRAAGLAGTVHLLALSEDWCGDAVNSLPVVARLAEATPAVELRVLGRDANPDLMDAHRTNGTRSIPVVIAYDADFNEVGWWGPRPAELQRLFETELRSLPKDERNRRVRTWYARDRGRSTVTEVLDLIVRAAARPSTAMAPAG
jgi:Thioredoxin